MVLWAVLGCGEPGPDPAGPAPGEAVEVEDGVGRLVALALARGEIGRTGSRLDPENNVIERIDARTWRIRIGEVEPGLEPTGIDRRVDPFAATCDGVSVAADPVPRDRSFAEAEAEAWACAISLGGVGVGGSPLVRESLRMRWLPHGPWLAFFAEEQATTLPAGLDLAFGRGHCSRLPMD